jgi:hypothetical protein
MDYLNTLEWSRIEIEKMTVDFGKKKMGAKFGA